MHIRLYTSNTSYTSNYYSFTSGKCEGAFVSQERQGCGFGTGAVPWPQGSCVPIA